jgi:CTP:molybdopterin cytidylyltransferase MocA
VIPAVVLAAGASSRFGSPKQRLLLPAVLERLGRAQVDRIVVVEGAHPLAEVVAPPAELVRCPEWRRGPGASLRCGLAALADDDGALVVLADGPNLDPRAVERVLALRHEADVLAATYSGVRGHPVWLARAVWPWVPDEGMRAIPARLVPCDDLEPPGDVDYSEA